MLKPSPAPPSLSLGRRPLIVIELSLCLSRYCELSGPGDAEHMRYCFSEYGAPGDAEARRLPTELAFVENGQDRRSALVRALRTTIGGFQQDRQDTREGMRKQVLGA